MEIKGQETRGHCGDLVCGGLEWASWDCFLAARDVTVGHIRGAGIAFAWLGGELQEQLQAERESDGQGTEHGDQRHRACCLRKFLGVLAGDDGGRSYRGRR